MRRVCLMALMASLFLGMSPARSGAASGPGAGNGIYIVEARARDALLALGATVHHGRVEGGFLAELSREEAASLLRRGFSVRLVFDTLEEQDRVLRSQPDFEQFHTYDQIRADFQARAAAHPDIARYEILGHSVQGREIFGLKITTRPDVEEGEPELAFWGGIHGDEYAGGELPYRYALYLCDSYGVDPTVTQFVEDNEIWCIPMINPDGRVLGRRTNANNIDLNRDFGYEWSGEGGSPSAYSQPETRAIREFCEDENISLSLTFHCSGDVVFYPWGYAPQNVPDLSIIRDVSQRYAGVASYSFGDSWQDYETHGELIDQVYGVQGGICLTVEVSNAASALAQTIARNQAGMNLICGLGAGGLHGTVVDGLTGLPVSAAVWISGDPIPSYTDAATGDVHRLVPAGTYDLRVWANGAEPVVVAGVVVAEGVPGVFSAVVQPGYGEYAFAVTSVNQRDPNHAHVNATFPAAALGAPDGVACSIGSSGFIVLDMGEGHEIPDVSGPDFTVTEAITTADPNPESYRIYTGDSYTQSILIGTATGTSAFDLAAAGLSSARYLRIVDASGAPPNGPFAGVDIDGVQRTFDPAYVQSSEGAALPVQLAPVVYPNPVRSSAVLSFLMPAPGSARVIISDPGGREVRRIVREDNLSSGFRKLPLDMSGLASGRYFYRVEAGTTAATGSLLLLR